MDVHMRIYTGTPGHSSELHITYSETKLWISERHHLNLVVFWFNILSKNFFHWRQIKTYIVLYFRYNLEEHLTCSSLILTSARCKKIGYLILWVFRINSFPTKESCVFVRKIGSLNHRKFFLRMIIKTHKRRKCADDSFIPFCCFMKKVERKTWFELNLYSVS